MIPSPIHKVLLTFRNSGVRSLLMGGQACILYGGAEFSRDIDFSIAIDSDNLSALRHALDLLHAEPLYVPPLSVEALTRGHACHFRCRQGEADGLRIDLMAKMRGCSGFEELWERRTRITLPEIGEVGVLSLPDLIQAKKTQRDKDWPMIRRLIEADMAQAGEDITSQRIEFWIAECRTPSLLIDLGRKFIAATRVLSVKRPLLQAALEGNAQELEKGLLLEEQDERHKDSEYWAPLRQELEKWRMEARKSP